MPEKTYTVELDLEEMHDIIYGVETVLWEDMEEIEKYERFTTRNMSYPKEVCDNYIVLLKKLNKVIGEEYEFKYKAKYGEENS